ncbi:MAG: NAD kinase [Crocinitomicaceae bacterium]|nr:NAD kinase [Crocinitomicaceae bacterium]
MNIAIYGKKTSSKEDLLDFETLIAVIQKHGWNPILECNLKNIIRTKISGIDELEIFSSHLDFQAGIDLVISVGGDGTFIKTVGFIRDSGVPILGINTGRLGFLANIRRDEIEETMELIHQKNYVFEVRSLLSVETKNKIFGEDNFALNEVTVHKKDTASMITVNATLGDEYLNSYWADGLIVATPTGSTAYSLSCGGPIITPGCHVHILTPIAAHNLNVRPMVVPDNLEIKLTVEGREKSYLVSLDSKTKNIAAGEEIIIRKADFMLNVIKFKDNSFLSTIRKKMLWGIDQRN